MPTYYTSCETSQNDIVFSTLGAYEIRILIHPLNPSKIETPWKEKRQHHLQDLRQLLYVA